MFGVVDAVERVDLRLRLGQRVGERLLIEVAEQRLVKALVLPRVVGLYGLPVIGSTPNAIT
jgi:hypothetical protein